MTYIYKYIDHTEKDKMLDLISEILSEENAHIVSEQWAWRYENHPFITKQLWQRSAPHDISLTKVFQISYSVNIKSIRLFKNRPECSI